MGSVRRALSIVWRAILAFIEDQALTHGAAIAFFTVLSLAPILMLLIWTSGLLGSGMQERLVEHAADLIGSEGAVVIRMVIDNADANPEIGSLAGWVGLGVVLFSATGVLAQLQLALNAIWGVRPDPDGTLGIMSWLRKRLLSLGLIASFGFLLLVSLVITSALSAAAAAVGDVLPGADVTWIALDVLLPAIVYTVIFMAVFRYLPDARLRWRHVWFGAAITAGLFVLGKWIIGLYLGTSALGSAYGAAGSLVVLLVWTYYSAAIVLFGAELTRAHVSEQEERVPVEPHAVPDVPEPEVKAPIEPDPAGAQREPEGASRRSGLGG